MNGDVASLLIAQVPSARRPEAPHGCRLSPRSTSLVSDVKSGTSHPTRSVTSHICALRTIHILSGVLFKLERLVARGEKDDAEDTTRERHGARRTAEPETYFGVA